MEGFSIGPSSRFNAFSNESQDSFTESENWMNSVPDLPSSWNVSSWDWNSWSTDDNTYSISDFEPAFKIPRLDERNCKERNDQTTTATNLDYAYQAKTKRENWDWKEYELPPIVKVPRPRYPEIRPGNKLFPVAFQNFARIERAKLKRLNPNQGNDELVHRTLVKLWNNIKFKEQIEYDPDPDKIIAVAPVPPQVAAAWLKSEGQPQNIKPPAPVVVPPPPKKFFPFISVVGEALPAIPTLSSPIIRVRLADGHALMKCIQKMYFPIPKMTGDDDPVIQAVVKDSANADPKAIPPKPPMQLSSQDVEELSNDDNDFGERELAQIAATRYCRNDELMGKLFSDTIVKEKEVSPAVAEKRLMNLKSEFETLEKHRVTTKGDIEKLLKGFEEKKKKMQQDSETFQAKIKESSLPFTDAYVEALSEQIYQRTKQREFNLHRAMEMQHAADTAALAIARSRQPQHRYVDDEIRYQYRNRQFSFASNGTVNYFAPPPPYHYQHRYQRPPIPSSSYGIVNNGNDTSYAESARTESVEQNQNGYFFPENQSPQIGDGSIVDVAIAAAGIDLHDIQYGAEGDACACPSEQDVSDAYFASDEASSSPGDLQIEMGNYMAVFPEIDTDGIGTEEYKGNGTGEMGSSDGSIYEEEEMEMPREIIDSSMEVVQRFDDNFFTYGERI